MQVNYEGSILYEASQCYRLLTTLKYWEPSNSGRLKKPSAPGVYLTDCKKKKAKSLKLLGYREKSQAIVNSAENAIHYYKF